LKCKNLDSFCEKLLKPAYQKTKSKGTRPFDPSATANSGQTLHRHKLRQFYLYQINYLFVKNNLYETAGYNRKFGLFGQTNLIKPINSAKNGDLYRMNQYRP